MFDVAELVQGEGAQLGPRVQHGQTAVPDGHRGTFQLGAPQKGPPHGGTAGVYPRVLPVVVDVNLEQRKYEKLRSGPQELHISTFFKREAADKT